MHSLLTKDQLNSAFRKSSHRQTKIVLATNIAESGITIPDVVFVVDAGRVKENKFVIVVYVFYSIHITFHSI